MNDPSNDESGEAAAAQLQSKQHLFDQFQLLMKDDRNYPATPT